MINCIFLLCSISIQPHFFGAEYSTTYKLEYANIELVYTDNYITNNFEPDSKINLTYTIEF